MSNKKYDQNQLVPIPSKRLQKIKKLKLFTNTTVQMETILFNNTIKGMSNRKILTKRKDKIIFLETKIKFQPIIH